MTLDGGLQGAVSATWTPAKRLRIQAFFLNIAIYIAIQLASGLIYALAGVVKDGAYFETCVARRVCFALSHLST